ncbi:MAG: hypothetical protein SFT81_05505 [Candidatus Caenarcaniphilales bacterium]|nr:hypothetical protein [Candidatus Caenarcaniphilales bacterium]
MDFKELIKNRKISKLALSLFFLLREQGNLCLTNKELAMNLGGYCTRSIQNALRLLRDNGYIDIKEERLKVDARRKRRLVSMNGCGNLHEIYDSSVVYTRNKSTWSIIEG